MSDLTRDYPSNSESDRVEESPKKDIQKVTSGSLRRPSATKRLGKAMIAEDAKSVGSYVLWDIIIPAAKEMVSTAVSSGIERALFGESYSSKRGSTRKSGWTSYRSPSRVTYSSSPERRERKPREEDPIEDISDVLIPTRQEAYEVVDRLREVAERYDIATLGDLYGLVGISSKYTDEDWGWTPDGLHDCGVKRVRDGFILEIPDPSYLKGGR